MDPESVDQNYAQLQRQAQQTGTLIQTLASKLQTATANGNPDAREWLLDLKEITLNIQQQQAQTSLLLQTIHTMVDNHVQNAPAPQVPPSQPGYQNSPLAAFAGGGAGGGGFLQRFLGGGLGQAVVAGAGFGVGDELIQQIF